MSAVLALAYADAVNEELRDAEGGWRGRRPDRRAVPRAVPSRPGNTPSRRSTGHWTASRATRCSTHASATRIVHDRLSGYPFLRELNECAATHVSLEAAQPDLQPEVLRELPDKVIVLGVLDLGSAEAETPDVVAGRIRRALEVARPSGSSWRPTAG